MIKIKKTSADTPPSLLTAGVAEINALKQLSPAQLLAYSYKSSLYGSKQVKDKLKELQHHKCCFCAAKVSHVSHGDVEHYRPKAGWMQDDGGQLTRPGYYWMAYNFSNLYLSCQICNQKFKKNYFPLSNPSKRVTHHTGTLSAEKPLIIDPGRENPALSLSFNKEIAVARNKSPKGKATIERTGLNRPEIVSERFAYLKLLELLAAVARGTSADAPAARQYFKTISKADSLYSLMVISNFPDLAT